MYRTLNTMNDARGVLSKAQFPTAKKCDQPEKPATVKYLESMFFSPLEVPEQGKVIQSMDSVHNR